MIKIDDTIKGYDKKNIHIGTLGGHSALDVARGAKTVGFKTVVVCQKGREKTYSRYYKNLFDEIIIVDKFEKLTNKNTVKKLQNLNTVFVQSRYFWVYCDYRKIEHSFDIPIFGTRGAVKLEERDVPNNQYYLMKKAGIRYPKIFDNPKDIDRLVLVKVAERDRAYERAFFFARHYDDYIKNAESLLKQKLITKKALEKSAIEEYVLGAHVNFNFFYSPIKKRLEIMGTDTRRQTSLDGIIRLPASQQVEVLNYVQPQYIETGHVSVTVKESLLEMAFELGERLVKVMIKELPPGIIGPFALQGAVVPGPPKEDFVTFDLSLRIPGSPGTSFTPYTNYLFGRELSVGERISMELKDALEKGDISKVVT